MGESSTCLVRSFSATASIAAGPREGDSLRALTTSISFGRFTSESLDWEKWSCFSSNRHVEEAEKSSKPGSVAAKKAYFEAHYKKIAAKKAAALFEQQVLASNELDLPISDNVDDSQYRPLVVSEPSKSDSPKTEIVASVDENVRDPNVEGKESKTDKAEDTKIATKGLATDEVAIQVDLSNLNENVEICSKVVLSQKENMATTPSSHQGNSSSTSKSIRSSDSLTRIRALKLQSSVKLSPVQESKEDSITQTCKKAASNLVDKKRSTLKSLHMSINFASRASEISKTQPIIHKVGSSETVKSFAKASRDSSALQIPTQALVNRVSVHHTQIHLPPPEGRRRTKPTRASGNKGRPPIVTSSFSFRCEERAAKRKEKLEENLYAGGENMRLQSKSKILLPQPRSLILGRKPAPSMVKDTGSLLPWISSINMDGSKHRTLKRDRTLLYSTNAVSRKNTQENASVNIQL